MADRTTLTVKGTPVPPILYHYTSIEAFHAIVTSRSFLATQIQYLNDAQEIRHALERAREIIDVRSAAARSDDTVVLAAMAEQLASICGARMFLIALSEDGDLLNQWRAYCPRGGVSLGLDTAALVKAASANDFMFERCVYDPDERDQAIDEVISDSLADFRKERRAGNSESDAAAFCGRNFYGRMLQRATAIKHHAFAQEREWRAVGGPFAYDHPAAGWRPRGSHLIPYLRFTFKTFELAAVIRQVTIGPSPDQELLYESVLGFLTNEGWSGVSEACLANSSIPYRADWS